MADQFKPVTWQSGEPVDVDKLNRMNSNIQTVFDRMPKTVYRGGGVRVTEGVKMISGLRLVPATKKSWATVAVDFGNSMFANNCTPIVTTGIIAKEQRLDVVVHGRGRLLPDSRGVVFGVHSLASNKKNRRIRKCFIAFTAVGY